MREFIQSLVLNVPDGPLSSGCAPDCDWIALARASSWFMKTSMSSLELCVQAKGRWAEVGWRSAIQSLSDCRVHCRGIRGSGERSQLTLEELAAASCACCSGQGQPHHSVGSLYDTAQPITHHLVELRHRCRNGWKMTGSLLTPQTTLFGRTSGLHLLLTHTFFPQNVITNLHKVMRLLSSHALMYLECLPNLGASQRSEWLDWLLPSVVSSPPAVSAGKEQLVISVLLIGAATAYMSYCFYVRPLIKKKDELLQPSLINE